MHRQRDGACSVVKFEPRGNHGKACARIECAHVRTFLRHHIVVDTGHLGDRERAPCELAAVDRYRAAKMIAAGIATDSVAGGAMTEFSRKRAVANDILHAAFAVADRRDVPRADRQFACRWRDGAAACLCACLATSVGCWLFGASGRE